MTPHATTIGRVINTERTMKTESTMMNLNPSSGRFPLRMGLLILAAAVASLLTAPALYAQVPAPSQNSPTALTGGTIHTVSQGVIENGTILFEDGVITAVGSNVELPAGTQQVDVSGKHIYPGLIDAYSQMGLYEIGSVDMTVDVNEQGNINPNARAAVAFNPESRHIGTARSSGVLVAVSSPGGGLISGQSSAMMLDGWTWEDMQIQGPTGLIVNWPYPRDEDDYEENIRQLRDAFADARAYRNAQRAAGNGDAARHESDTRWEAMIPVLDGDVPVVVNANELRQIQDAITWSEEEDVRMVLLGGRDAHYVTDHLVRNDIPVILTSVLSSPSRSWEPYDGDYGHAARLDEAGVRYAIAGSSSAPYAHRLPWEAGAAAAYGLSADQALRAVTQSPAEILGFDDRVGTLEVGKDATLLITTGNPLEYSTQIEQAYIEGREIDMMDSHRQFYEKYREKVDQRQAAQ